MRFVTTYQFKPFLTKEETEQVLAIFAVVGNAPGVTDHLVFTDGSGGVVFGESDDIPALYANALAYSSLIEFQSKIALTVEDAVPVVLASIAEESD